MRAWTILTFFVLFNMSFAVVNAMDIGKAPQSKDIRDQNSDFMNNLMNFDYLGMFSLITGIGTLLGSYLLNLPVGAAIYAITASANLFAFSNVVQTLNGYTEQTLIVPELKAFIAVAIGLVFLWGFIDLAS